MQNGRMRAQAARMSPSKPRAYTPPPGEEAADSSSLGAYLRKLAVNHQLGISINLVLLATLSWLLFPSLRPRLQAFTSLSYRSAPSRPLDGGAFYGQGPRDIGLVVTFIVLFTGIRAAMLDYVLTPLGGALGLKKKLKLRFAEQSYLILYYTIYWGWGVYLLARDTPGSLPTSTDGGALPLTVNNFLISLWTHYPRLLLDIQVKLYYLSQLAFWAQQIVVIHLEERRKDHYQMLTHHFITVMLLACSYGYRQTRVGNAVLVCMDIIDVIFPTAKVLKYLGWQTACDMAFALFVISWVACRHVAYLAICWSIYAHVDSAVMPYGVYTVAVPAPETRGRHRIVSGARISADGGTGVWEHLFQPILHPGATTVSFNANIRWTFLGLLLGLQCITIAWFFMICRVVVRVLRGQGADDSRSDDEDEGEDVEDDLDEAGPGPVQPSAPFASKAALHLPPPNQRYIEVEASSADTMPSAVKRGGGGGSSSSSNGSAVAAQSKRKSKGLSTGLNLGEHKDILNRIGCLSEEQLAREREKRSPGPSGPGQGRR